MKGVALAASLGFVLSAAPVFAQTPPPQLPPGQQAKPTQPPKPTVPAPVLAPPVQPPAPFPAGAKVGLVNVFPVPVVP